jgi:hypothetical protein
MDDHRNSFVPKGYTGLSTSCPASPGKWSPSHYPPVSPAPQIEEEEYDEQIENLLISKGTQFGDATIESMLQLKQLGKSKLNDFFFTKLNKEKSSLLPAFTSTGGSSGSRLLESEPSITSQEDEEEKKRTLQKTQSFLNLAQVQVSREQPGEKTFERNLSAISSSFCAGEVLLESAEDIMCGFQSIHDKVLFGDLFLSNFQLYFRSKSGSTNWSSPCTTIDRIMPMGEMGVASQEREKYEGFGLYRKDFDVDLLIASCGDKLNPLIQRLKQLMSCNPVQSIFAFSFAGVGARLSKVSGKAYFLFRNQLKVPCLFFSFSFLTFAYLTNSRSPIKEPVCHLLRSRQ